MKILPVRFFFDMFETYRSGAARSIARATEWVKAAMNSQSCFRAMGTTRCNPFPPVVFTKLSKPDFFEEILGAHLRWHRQPRDSHPSSGSRIEIEDDPIGPLDGIPPRAPHVDFQARDLCERDQTLFASLDDEIFLLARLFADANSPQLFQGRNVAGMFLKEARSPSAAAGTANDRQRPIDHVWQHPIGDVDVILSQIALRHTRFGKEHSGPPDA